MNSASTRRAGPADHPRGGFPLGLGAYALWGVLPIYFKAVADVPATDIVAHRVLWSLPFLALPLVLAVVLNRGALRPALRSAFFFGFTLSVVTVRARVGTVKRCIVFFR